ncbi:uncharacterized protein LOC113010324 isoform X2 [Astatotilapia calliptera]|uniref:uncharacterized protein LOC113010324 isoform X2 n=1 Tax=Astatotilapia calliptera TaxID=8154 RepID=UPI000E3FADFB|nr:uncharacterized protein LOC113010324 isoform X2 [Astatotilapia calliptera]
MILLPHLDSFTSADTFNSRQVFVLVCLTVGGWWYNYDYHIFGSGTKLSVTDGNQSTQKRTTQAPRVPANTQQSPTRPAGPRVHVEGNSSLLCVPPAMFPHLVQLSCKRQKKNGRLEELPPADGEQLELRESGRNTSILLIHQQEKSTYKCTCWVKHEGGTVEARTQQELPAPAASCPPEREPADLPALQPADLSFQSQCRVKLLCLLYTVLIVKSLVYCCGLSLLMMLTNKGASTNCTHAD